MTGRRSRIHQTRKNTLGTANTGDGEALWRSGRSRHLNPGSPRAPPHHSLFQLRSTFLCRARASMPSPAADVAYWVLTTVDSRGHIAKDGRQHVRVDEEKNKVTLGRSDKGLIPDVLEFRALHRTHASIFIDANGILTLRQLGATACARRQPTSFGTSVTLTSEATPELVLEAGDSIVLHATKQVRHAALFLAYTAHQRVRPVDTAHHTRAPRRHRSPIGAPRDSVAARALQNLAL